MKVRPGITIMIVLALVVTGCEDDEPVREQIDKIVVNPGEITVWIDSTYQLTAEAHYESGDIMPAVEFTWTSADSQVARVSQTGLVTAVKTGLTTIGARADGVVSNDCQVTVKEVMRLAQAFPADFPVIRDQLTGNPLSGWGGSGEVQRRPVVFIHGNGTNAGSWITFGEYLLDQGYAPSEVWAISYLDFLGGDSANGNWANLEDIDHFISAVKTYTGSGQVDLICHSLGVTVGRAWLKAYDTYSQVSHFAGIAGANHGVAFCAGDTLSTICRELGHPQSEFLTWLNQPDETPHDSLVQYLTLYDGTGVDVFFPAQTIMSDDSVVDLRESPLLEGALNVQFTGFSHGYFLTSPASMDTVLSFLATGDQ